MDKVIGEDILNEIFKYNSNGEIIKNESYIVEYKANFNFGSMAEYLKYFNGFANTKGGYLIFGIDNKQMDGMSPESKDQFIKIDKNQFRRNIHDYLSPYVEFVYGEKYIDSKFFGVMYILEALNKPVICKRNAGNVYGLLNREIKN